MSLYRKYRPQKFSDLIGEDHIRDTLLLAIRENRTGQGYLFSGLRGTGKTTVARLMAKSANCQKRQELNASGSGEPCLLCSSCKEIALGKSLDVIEIDAASNRGIDEIRELRDKVKFAPANGNFKVFIIDEVHMLTTPAFNALLKTLEEPPKHAIFILATTEAHKLPATILSRVQRFDFRRIDKQGIVKNLKIIAKSEKFNITDEALEAIAVAGDGSHRDAISILEQLASNSSEISITEVRNILGLARSEEILKLISMIADGELSVAIKVVSDLIESGVEASQIIKEIIEILRQTLLVKISSREVKLELTAERIDQISKLSESFSATQLNKILSIFIESNQLLKDSSIRSLPIEMAIIEASALMNNPKPDNVSVIKNQIEEKNSPSGKQPSIPTKSIEEKKSQLNEDVKSPSENSSSEIEPISDALWKEILDKVKENNHTLSALLRDAKPKGVADGCMVLEVRFKFHHDKIMETGNRKILEDIISQVFDNQCLIKCKVGKSNTASKPKQEETEDLDKKAEEIFDLEQ